MDEAGEFPRALDALANDRYRWSTLGVAVLLLSVWGTWFISAEVTIYAVSESARIEVERETSPLDARASGRIVASRIELGREVEEGEIMAEIDCEIERRELDFVRATIEALEIEVEVLEREREALIRVDRAEAEAVRRRVAEAEAEAEEARERGHLASVRAEKIGLLEDLGYIADLELLELRAKARSGAAEARARAFGAARVRSEGRGREAGVAVESEHLQGKIARSRGEIAMMRARSLVLEAEIERRKIIAPIDGRIVEVAAVTVGSVVDSGARLGTIEPEGPLKIVAYYPAGVALGRIHPEAPAKLRLAGFPWPIYGAIEARVARVAGEVREGRVRVELEIESSMVPRHTLQHGLPGTLEVAVERVSPAELVLRQTAGRLFDSANSADDVIP